MRRVEFRTNSPGELVSIPGGHAFVPNRLPPKIEVTWPLATSLELASRALSRLDGQALLIQNRDLIIRPLLTREAVESARLEGTHTHIAEVLLEEGDVPPSDPEVASNQREVLNYLSAAEDGHRWLADEHPINLTFLRSLHSSLLKRTRGENRRPGEFRPGQVVIGSAGATPASARFVPPPAEHVLPAIEDLLRFIQEDNTYPPLVAAGIAHYQFETIHPFEDGNGRLGRLLIPLQLISVKAVNQPLIYLSPFFESRRDEYLRRLKEVSTLGAWNEWLMFFFEAVIAQANDAHVRVERILEIQQRYRTQAGSANSKIPLLAIDLVMEMLVVTVADLVAHASCSPHTARSALDTLTAMGIVESVGTSHPQRWWARSLIAEVYER